MKTLNYLSLMVLATVALSACEKGSTTYSLLAEGQTFRQNSSNQDTKIDVLWVIDNSQSMRTSQENLSNNFPSFIQKFTKMGYDFQIGVTNTDAYLDQPMYTPIYERIPTPIQFGGRPQEEVAWLKDGTWGNPSGYRIITAKTPNLLNVFMQNAMQGIDGRADERSFQSMRSALASPGNASFVRPGAFLAVILLTDEDDFSHAGIQQYKTYDQPLDTIDSYVNFLETKTGTAGASRRFSVNTIAIHDKECFDSISLGGQKMGVRVGQLADATGGIKANICGNFADELALIADSIVELSTQFFLNGNPVPSSIRVYVNENEVPLASENPLGTGGFAYNSAANSIMFSGDYIPPQSASIKINFDPATIEF